MAKAIPKRLARLQNTIKLVLKVQRPYSIEYLSYMDGKYYGCVEKGGEVTDWGFYSENAAWGIDKEISDGDYSGEFVYHIDTPLSEYCEKIFEDLERKTGDNQSS